ncbi:MAG: beta-3-deoxy-D-manno-oct-2-ulosonic acid transferase [Alteraurantiacibacter sp.]
MTAPTNSSVPALLRTPPFAGLEDGALPPPPCIATQLSASSREELFKTLREARVGGAFWAPGCKLEAKPQTVLRPRKKTEFAALQDQFEGQGNIWIARNASLSRISAMVCGPQVDPWSILPQAERLVAHGDDEWVPLARILGLPVYLLSAGPFGGPDDTDDALDAKAGLALAQPMRDPFADGWLEPVQAIALLSEWRRIIDGNRGGAGEKIVAAYGMSWWKRTEIRRFLWLPERPLQFALTATGALSMARKNAGALAVWPSRISPDLVSRAREKGVPLVRVEDGFVRSAGLGSNLVPPSSVVVDRSGIHFDPSKTSDLEAILASAEFSPAVLERARRLREAIIAARISKYSKGKSPDSRRLRVGEQRIVLVPGQVENDMSVLAGGGGITSNLELLRRTRKLVPDAQIWWRPHPDVDAGHRVGAIPDDKALQYADRIVRDNSIADLLDQVDELHVLTSLTGFEALLRGRRVTCHGTPFFAGWGLTCDLAEVPDRRGRNLALDELVAGVLLLYPRYLDPVTGLPCPPEILIRRMAQDDMFNRQSWIEPLRRMQGRFVSRFRAGQARKQT